MRIAALSDIHGNLPALEAVLADLEGIGADVIVDLGDIASGPLWPAETVDRLMALGWPTIAGNHERHVLDDGEIGESDQYARDRLDAGQKAWFAGLPGTMWLNEEVFLCHGTPKSDQKMWLETLDAVAGAVRPASAEEIRQRAGMDLSRASLVLCGHTHVARRVDLDGTLIVNPGSVGLQAIDLGPAFNHTAIEAGTPHARYAVVSKRAGGWDVELRQVVYDWQSAAEKAAQEGRMGWARGLATGRVR